MNKLVEKIVEKFLNDMSQEEKDALIEKIMEKFLDEMTPEEKEQLIERVAHKLLEGVDMASLLPRLFKIILKKAGTSEEEQAGFLNTMSRMASDAKRTLTSAFKTPYKKELE